uniref:phospholipase D n=2 Tax=Mesocestoides corti TaxID=53468 RepID=A0A5K3F5B2_MESCO
MDGVLELSFEGSSSDDDGDDSLTEQENYFPAANDVFESGQIFLPHEPIKIEITHVYWTSRFNYIRDRVKSPSFSQQTYTASAANDGESNDEVTAASTSHKVPSRYEISIQHGPFKWRITRTYNDVVALHREITLDQVKRRVIRVTQTVKSGFQQTTPTERLSKRRLSVFPKRPTLVVNEEYMSERTRVLQEYLQSIVNVKQLRYLEGVMRFFEISPITFRVRLGTSKYKEGTILKIPKSRRFAFLLFPCCVSECAWQSRWLVLKDSYMVMLKPSKLEQQKALPSSRQRAGSVASQMTLQTVVGERNPEDAHLSHHNPRAAHRWHHRSRRWRYCKVILMDQFFNFSTHHSGVGPVLHIGNMHIDVNFRTFHGSSVGEWMDKITKVISEPSALGYVQTNPNKSFAPVRKDGKFLLCIDGASYMDAVADGINQAQHEIFITDWWLSPEIFLKRPGGADKWRLDLLLKRKAEAGVRICILIYRELSVALKINSKHTSRWLSSLHPNIHVIRHPDHIRDSVLLWSHHEKMVVIDQSIAFMGGIDLCYGRWDRQDHPLIDLDKSEPYSRGASRRQVQLEDAAKSIFVALMPITKSLPDLNAQRVTDSHNQPLERRDSLSVIFTDAPQEEIDRDRRARTGGSPTPPLPDTSSPLAGARLNFQSLASAAKAAVAWKKQTSQTDDIEQPGFKVMPDGQMAFRSSVRTRRSARRNRQHLAREAPAKPEGVSGRCVEKDENFEPTMDIQIPGIGRLQVPIDAPQAPQGVASSHDRRGSKKHTRHLSSGGVKRKSSYGRRRTLSQSVMNERRVRSPGLRQTNFASPPIVISSPGEDDSSSTADKPRRPRFSTVDFGNRIQGFFARVGSQRKRSPVPRVSESDSDDSDDLEYDNLGFYARRQSKAPFGKLRRGLSTVIQPEIGIWS